MKTHAHPRRRLPRTTARTGQPAAESRPAALAPLLASPRLQAKLTIGAPHDAYEQEANRVAETVMRMPTPGPAGIAPDAGGALRRQPGEEEEEERIQPKAEAGRTPTLNAGVESSLRAAGAGRPLNDHARSFFEPRFGRNLDDVRVHADATADSLARSINARAFTIDRHTFFRQGEYDPQSLAGRHLLAHELTHVVQQTGGQTAGGPRIQRWTDLGTESWTIPGFTSRSMTVWTGTEAEWTGELNNMDDEDEYDNSLWGFLQVSNDPSIVNRTRAPRHIGNVPYSNTITRAPTAAEKLEFLRALYAMGGNLDLWHGGALEGGAWVAWADQDLSKFLRDNQGMLIADVSRQGRVISSSGVQAVSDQGGSRATMSMIINAGATAHKGVDLIAAANRQSGQARQSAHAIAMETIRNSGRVIRESLRAHDARVAFQQQVVGTIFDTVWGMIPGGGTLSTAAMGLLKEGLKEGLKQAQTQGGPAAQAEKINEEFVATCNRLVLNGHMQSADAQDAINGFEAVRRP